MSKKDELVEVSEEKVNKRIEKLEKKIDNPESIEGKAPFFKNTSEVREHLEESHTVDFLVPGPHFDSEDTEPAEVGYVREVPPRKDSTDEGYSICARSMDAALSRIVHIIDEGDGGIIYFQVITPDQQRPLMTNKDRFIRDLQLELAVWEEAKRAGEVRRGYLEK